MSYVVKKLKMFTNSMFKVNRAWISAQGQELAPINDMIS